MAPEVSAIMAAYNAERFVRSAVESILRQSFTSLECIVIDDGSSDGTWEVLRDLAHEDARVRLVRNTENLGVAESRNRGTALARGEFIGVVDADDISLPERFGVQVAYLRRNPEIGAVGAMMRLMDENGQVSEHISRWPILPGHVAWVLCFGSAIPHPASMIRSQLLRQVGGYRREYAVAHDYDLWQRLSAHTKLSSLPDVLVHYRRHTTNITTTLAYRGASEVQAIARRAMRETLGVEVDETAAALLAPAAATGCLQGDGTMRLLEQMGRRFLATNGLSLAEHRAIRADVARRLRRLAVMDSSRAALPTGVWRAARWDLYGTCIWAGSMLKSAALRRMT